MNDLQAWEYCAVEWMWSENGIRIIFPDGRDTFHQGSYVEVIKTLTQLGLDGWEVATCAGVANWLLWTLKRYIQKPSNQQVR